METEIFEPFEVLRLPDGLLLDLEGFSRVLRWEGRDRRNLKLYVLDEFGPAVKARTVYSDQNRPKEEVDTAVRVGTAVFRVTTKPTTKRPSYAYVVDDLENFLIGDMERYQEERLRSGFRTLRNSYTGEQEHYLPLRAVIERIEVAGQAIMEGKYGISQSVRVVGPEELTVTPDKLWLMSERDYAALTEENARAYALGSNLADVNGAAAKGFRAMLLDDTLHKLGGEPDHPVGIRYVFDQGVFIHQVEPRRTVSYSAIVDGFIKEPKGQTTKRSRVGDLRLLELIHDGAEKLLRDKGLVDDEFLCVYDMQVRDGMPYVRIEGVALRLVYHRGKSTDRTIEQNIVMQPPYFH